MQPFHTSKWLHIINFGFHRSAISECSGLILFFYWLGEGWFQYLLWCGICRICHEQTCYCLVKVDKNVDRQFCLNHIEHWLLMLVYYHQFSIYSHFIYRGVDKCKFFITTIHSLLLSFLIMCELLSPLSYEIN